MTEQIAREVRRKLAIKGDIYLESMSDGSMVLASGPSPFVLPSERPPEPKPIPTRGGKRIDPAKARKERRK